MRYRPCDTCPFFDPNQLYLNPARKSEIVESIRDDRSFDCHKTMDYTDDGPVATKNTQECVGSMILQEREGRANQMMRIMERVGLYDRDRLDLDSVPYASFDDWIEGTAR